MKDKSISFKEELFCQSFIKLCNLKEAAKQSGYSYKKALLLCAEKRILARCSEIISKDLSPSLLAIQSLKRLAFSDLNDAFYLIMNADEISSEQLANLDLFPVSSVSRSKTGQVEIKFYDRLKAIELLLLNSDNDGSGLSSFIEALKSSSLNGAKIEPDKV